MSECTPLLPGTHISFSFPAEVESISEIRHLIVSFARVAPFSYDDLDDIALAISEIFTNLLKYTSAFRIHGTCEVTPKHLEVRFDMEQNISQYLGQRQFPHGMSQHGRGIPLVNLLIPVMEMHERVDGRWELRLVKSVPTKKE